jgi:hypothetical protein
MISHKVLIVLQPDGQAFDQQNMQNDSFVLGNKGMN